MALKNELAYRLGKIGRGFNVREDAGGVEIRMTRDAARHLLRALKALGDRPGEVQAYEVAGLREALRELCRDAGHVPDVVARFGKFLKDHGG